jgi:GT2 family glycosyltransferase
MGTRSRLPGEPEASILLVTFNRLRMLTECLASILANTGGVDYEVIAWDNASTDGTREYLDDLAAQEPRVRPVHAVANIGVNAVAETVKLARSFHMVEMDDDVLSVPPGWLPEMIRSFDRVPRAGYLAANVVQNDLTDGAKPPINWYHPVDYGDGWCTMTSAEVIARIGNFMQISGRIFFAEDGEFVQRCLQAGYNVGIVRSVVVHHATGAPMNKRYGYLDVCKLKYSDDPAYRPWLEETLRHMDDKS